MYRLKKSAELFGVVITLLAHGCPVQAIVAAFGLDERTVADWQQRAGQQAQRVHEHLVQQGQLELQHVQADEIRVKRQKGIVWMAMAIMVGTRLWLGGVVGTTRDRHLIRALAEQVRACALPAPILLAVDGLSAYLKAFRRAFSDPLRTGRRGRPRLIPWPDVAIVQVVKRYARGRVVSVERRIVQGLPTLLARLLFESQGGILINTAFVERLNATFRQCLAPLARRTRCLARLPDTLTDAMFLLGCVYNFCRHHCALRLPDKSDGQRTPAMAAGLTDHCWSVLELMTFRVPPPPFVPPKRRGRKPKVRMAVMPA